MGEQSNILILLLQELVLPAPSFCPPLLLKSLIIIGLLKAKMRGITGLLRGLVGRFLLLGNAWILGGGYKTLMLRFLEELRQRSMTKENNRGSISLVQKASRASERAKKRVAIEQAREEGEPGNQVGVRAQKRGKVPMGAPKALTCSGLISSGRQQQSKQISGRSLATFI
jgi:hypothetical protein